MHGPLLINIYINDIVKFMADATFIVFEHDTNLCLCSANTPALVETANIASIELVG